MSIKTVHLVYNTLTPEMLIVEVDANRKAYVEALRTRSGRSHHYERENALDSTWDMESLIHSVWVNVYTFSVVQVTGVSQDRADKPELRIGEKWHQHIGLWWDDRYVIDNYNRVDHLSEDLRRLWYQCVYNKHRKANSLYRDDIGFAKLIGEFPDIEESFKPLVFKQLELL